MSSIFTNNKKFDVQIKNDYPMFQTKISNNFFLAKITKEMSLVSNRILSLIILLLRDKPTVNRFTLKVSKIERFLGYKGSASRNTIYSSFKELASCERQSFERGIMTMSIKMISNLVIDQEKKEITYDIDDFSKNKIFDLSNSYTSLNWIYTYNMKSRYGQRLFEIISTQLFRENKNFTIGSNVLKEKLGIAGKYNRNPDLRRFVLEPAKSDINSFAPFYMDYEIESSVIKFSLSPKSEDEKTTIFDSLRNNKAIKSMIVSFSDISTYVEENIKTDEEIYEIRDKIYNREDNSSATFISDEDEKKTVLLDAKPEPEQLTIFDNIQ